MIPPFHNDRILCQNSDGLPIPSTSSIKTLGIVRPRILSCHLEDTLMSLVVLELARRIQQQPTQSLDAVHGVMGVFGEIIRGIITVDPNTLGIPAFWLAR